MEVGGIQLEVEQHVYLEASKSIDDHYDWSFPDTKSIIDIDTDFEGIACGHERQ